MTHISDKVDEYLEVNKIVSFDGYQGVKNLSKLVEEFGYDGYGGVITNFLADNPSAVETLVNWIRLNGCDEWKTSLEEAIAEAD